MQNKILIIIVVLGVISAAVIAWKKMDNKGYNNNFSTPATNHVVTTNTSLSEEDIKSLIKMRQEEKLARDVYLTLYKKFGIRTFSNIAESEQRHTDSVKMLLNKYNIQDPITDDTIGVFKDKEFTDLYNQLVAQGSKSEVDALKVGATIEDLDIKDLTEEINRTNNLDIKRVYENLRNGSYNHMRAFVKALSRYGETYTPQYISQEEFEQIISSSNGKGHGMGGGKGHGRGMGGGMGGGMGHGHGRGMGW